MKFALATSDDYPHLAGSEKLLVDAFRQQGDIAVPVVWNDASVDWEQFSAVIIRSCWGYYREIQAFEHWVTKLQQLQISFFNAPETIRWNSHKSYLLDLHAKGVPVPKTTLVKQGDKRTLKEVLDRVRDNTVVVKPCYGASAFEVMKVSRDNEDETAYRKLLSTGDVLVQSFIPDIRNGEYSAVFIDGKISHVVRKRPKSGDFRSNHEFGGTEELATLSAQILSSINRLFTLCDVQTLYARLDLVLTSSGPIIMELELIEPYLFFEFNAQAPAMLAAAAKKAVGPAGTP